MNELEQIANWQFKLSPVTGLFPLEHLDAPISKAQEQGNNNMCYNCKQTSASTSVQVDMVAKKDTSLEFLSGRLRDIYWSKQGEVREKFYPDQNPKTYGDALKMLASGDFRLIQSYGDYTPTVYFNAYEEPGFFWGKTVPDETAYNAAMKALDNSYELAKDTVSVLSDEQARLKALQDFQSVTFH